MGEFETVKEAASLRGFANDHLKKSTGGLWCCPACGSGTRGTRDSDGAFSITGDDRHWECFSCRAKGDIFDLAAIVYGIAEDDRRGQLEAVAQWAGVYLDDQAQTRVKGDAKKEPPAEPPKDYKAAREAEAAYIRANLTLPIEPDNVRRYLEGRGFTLEEARAEGIGYDPRKRRLIIPWKGAPWYHIDRAIDDVTKPKYLKPRRDDVGEQPLYNPAAAKEPVFFIVEGVLDAIAVSRCGYEAIALASNDISEANLTQLIEGIESSGSDSVAVIALDNDSKGREGAKKVEAALTEAGLPSWTIWDYPKDAPKDEAEWYKADSGGLAAFLDNEYLNALGLADRLKDDAYREALSALRVLDPVDVATSIYTLSDYEEPTPTGLTALDEVLGGGLRFGLYALGAASSMGKTTLAVQIADYIAEHGRGVLFVTIEQSAREIVAKSLARLTHTLNAGGWDTVSTAEIMSKARREAWSQGQNEAFVKACEYYTAHIAPSLKILEGTKQPSVADVAAVARMMKAHDGRSPVIFIDYLQLLAPISDRDTDKRAIDRNVTSLRQLARDEKAPIIAISSTNRSSYSEGVTMDSWKESGSIEYSADVLLGLQPKGLRETVEKATATKVKREAEATMRKHKAAYERECELFIIKQRNGATPEEGIPLTFKPISALYIEDGRGLKLKERPAHIV